MMARVQPPSNIFFTPENLGALPALWLQAKLTISLAPFQEKFAKLFQTIAVELWLRGRSNDIRDTFQVVARSITIQVAERLAKYICSLMRKAATLATPECLLFFCPSPLPFGGSTVLRLTRGPAGNRTTTGSLSAPSRTTPYQLSHEDT